MTPEDLHDLFVGAAGVAGALIGLLFVAISVERDRLVAADADQVQRVRARAALTTFVNALVVSLFALVPGKGIAVASIPAGAAGIVFATASVLSVRRIRRTHRTRTGRMRNVAFLIMMVAVFGMQIRLGIRLLERPHDAEAANGIATLVVVCFLIGIFRSWELIGGPEIGFGGEVRALVRERRHDHSPDEPR